MSGDGTTIGVNRGLLPIPLNDRDDKEGVEEEEEERTVVLLYHKPAGVVTTHATDDCLGRPNVYDDIRTMKGYTGNGSSDAVDKMMLSFEEVTGISSKLHAIGRLDADTTGLLLLTNDGGLVHRVTNYKNAVSSSADENTGECHRNDGQQKQEQQQQQQQQQQEKAIISKTYQAHVMGYHLANSTVLEQMRTIGVDLGAKHGGMTLPVRDISVLEHPTRKSTLISLTIVEGKNRQIRRMFHASGSGVMKLKRTHVGNLTLEGVQGEGQWRVLSEEEVQNCLHWTPRKLLLFFRNRQSSPSKQRRQKQRSGGGQKKSAKTRRRRGNNSKR